MDAKVNNGFDLDIGKQPQHLLLTLWGDYWFGCDQSVASNALMALLGEFGVSEHNGRAALSRLARRNMFVATRDGRQTRYQLTSKGNEELTDGSRVIFCFGRTGNEQSGVWTSVAFSIPETRRTNRNRLRTMLRRSGFSALYDGVWFAPGDNRSRAETILESLGVKKATLMVGEVSAGRKGDPVNAWDLDELRARYDSFISQFKPSLALIRQNRLTGREALLLRTAIIDVWRSFPSRDPDLPDAVLPANWPQKEALSVFQEIYDSLGPTATRQVCRIVGAIDETSSRIVRFHTCNQVINLFEPD